MFAKRVLIAHRSAAVRDRFAVALADARHEFVIADTEDDARRLAADAAAPVNLVLVDAGLASDGAAFVGALRRAGPSPVPAIVFSGTVRSAADILSLSAIGVGYINDYASTAQILPALAPHLFPDNFNRRASPRALVGVPISYRVGPAVTGAVTHDIGVGGLSIRTMTPLPDATALVVKFRLPGSPAEIEAACRVAWHDRRLGMGVRFERISAAHHRAIEAFVEERTTPL